jgi:hypothetical protein
MMNQFWLVSTAAAAVGTSWVVIKRRSLRAAGPADILSLGALIWLLVLKQLLQHYYMWALVPLIACGRWKSSFYLILGEVCGASLWGAGQLLSGSTPLSLPPSPASSALFLCGGLAFAFFDLMAMKKLLAELRAESGGDRGLVFSRRLALSRSKRA